MEIIQTKRFKGYDVTLIYFPDIKEYEIQISKKPYDEITDTDGFYGDKKIAEEVYDVIIKEIKEGTYKG